MDVREGGTSDPKRVRSNLPSGPREPTGQSVGVEPAETTGASGEPEGRGGSGTLKARALAGRQGRTVVFVDESGFYLLPAVVRTYAPVGKTPMLYEQLSREHLSAISAITEAGNLYMMEQERAASRYRTWSDF